MFLLWLGLVACGRSRRRWYWRNHDPLRAGGEDRRCPERNIRADALDEYEPA
jgi:hypothetical protein